MSGVVERAPELDLWREYVERRCGMNFAPRMRTLARCLGERMARGRFRTPEEYYHHVTCHPGGADEWRHLFALFLNGETRFFRDPSSFAALTRHVLPDLRGRDPARTLAAWSAGCSTGQEAYSLAMAGLDAGCEVGVTGTDVSPANLARSAEGRYRPFEAQGLSDDQRRDHFHQDGEDLRANDRLKGRVTFRPLDLTAGVFPLPPQDVIFCQNVLIYYSAAARAEMFLKLGRALAPGGYLFLGPAEGVGLTSPDLHPVRLDDAWIYQRRSPAPAGSTV